MEPKPPSQVSQLLQGWRDGDRKALDALLPLVNKELRPLAHFQLQNGLSLAEISEAMEIAPATVQRDWTAARAWLHREISRDTRV